MILSAKSPQLFPILLITWLACTISSMARAAPDDLQDRVLLHAGPISVRFKDGELRYLRVGDREIVRRIYFAVREPDWSTDMPSFSATDVQGGADHFKIHLAASCRGKAVSYEWTADITGSADGTIQFRVQGAPTEDGKANRVGLCVLYGSGALAGEEFLLADAVDSAPDGVFPTLISPDLIARGFRGLRYKTSDGLQVTCHLPESPFEMEDQRNYGDTSFKAYNPMRYAYPNVAKDQQMVQTLTVSVEGAPAPTPVAAGPARVRIGDAGKWKLPSVLPAGDFKTPPSFSSINHARKRYQDAPSVTWKWTPATHLPDDDMLMENLPGLAEQAATIHSFATIAVLRVGPIKREPAWIHLDRPVGFAEAWTVAAMKQLALGGIEETSFADVSPDINAELAIMKPLAGKEIADVEVLPTSSPVDCLAVPDGNATTVWLINRGPLPAAAILSDLPPGAKVQRLQLTSTARLFDPKPVAGEISLAPYEVAHLSLGK